jgi:hypothetical protein
MLLCGTDLLESLTTPGVWIPDQVSCYLGCLNALYLPYHIMLMIIVLSELCSDKSLNVLYVRHFSQGYLVS